MIGIFRRMVNFETILINKTGYSFLEGFEPTSLSTFTAMDGTSMQASASNNDNKRQGDFESQPSKRLCSTTEASKGENFIRVKKRKYAMLLGYSGANYLGMQRNKGAKTVEEDLISALHKTKLITDEEEDYIQKFDFQRAARTDKGVSAARQVCSLKLPETFNIDDINAHLPEDLRVFSLKKATKGFNSKSSCCGRTYMYLLPTYVFSPKPINIMDEEFRISPEIKDQINNIGKTFVGCHNFHNFTCKKVAKDPSSKRFIYHFECGDTFENGLEFMFISVKGQSFMYHMIRKMIAYTICVMKGFISEEIKKKIWTLDDIDIPLAPALGLFLNEVHYDRYNKRYSNDGIHEALIWDDIKDEIEDFKYKYICQSIVNTEVDDKPMYEWMQTLDWHSFDVRNHPEPSAFEKFTVSRKKQPDTRDETLKNESADLDKWGNENSVLQNNEEVIEDISKVPQNGRL